MLDHCQKCDNIKIPVIEGQTYVFLKIDVVQEYSMVVFGGQGIVVLDTIETMFFRKFSHGQKKRETPATDIQYPTLARRIRYVAVGHPRSPSSQGFLQQAEASRH